jgi:hypothetical protein
MERERDRERDRLTVRGIDRLRERERKRGREREGEVEGERVRGSSRRRERRRAREWHFSCAQVLQGGPEAATREMVARGFGRLVAQAICLYLVLSVILYPETRGNVSDKSHHTKTWRGASAASWPG